MQQLVLLRGLPGSGKSTIAKAMVGFQHYEADMFFIDQDGNYKFDPIKIKEAHEWCQRLTVLALIHGYDVVVSNTFTQQWEMQFYKDYAEQHGIRLVELTAKGTFDNTHGVPEASIAKMRERWED